MGTVTKARLLAALAGVSFTLCAICFGDRSEECKISADALSKECIVISGIDSDASCSYRLSNDGNANARLVYLGASCGCNRIVVDGMVLSKGDAVVIAANTSVECLATSSVRTLGNHSYNFGFEQDIDGPNKLLQMEFEVRVLPRLTMQPNASVVNVNDGEVHRRIDIEFVSRASENLNPTLQLQEFPHFVSTQILKTEKSAADNDGLIRSRWELSLLISKDLVDRGSEADSLFTLLFDLQHGERRVYSARHELLVRHSIGIVFPRLIDLGVISAGEPVKRRFIVSSVNREAFELNHYHDESEQEHRIVVAGNVGASAKHWVDLSFTGMRAGKVRKKIVLKTSDTVTPIIDIELHAIVAAD